MAREEIRKDVTGRSWLALSATPDTICAHVALPQELNRALEGGAEFAQQPQVLPDPVYGMCWVFLREVFYVTFG